MDKRRPIVIELEVKPEIEEKWRKILIDFYKDKYKHQEKTLAKVNEVIEICKNGWEYAPRTFEERIKIKSGYRNPRLSNLNIGPQYTPIMQEKKLEEVQKTLKEQGIDDLFTALTEEEKRWWKEREDIYYFEFKFNKSSDKPFILQLIAEELIQKRLLYNQLANPDNDYSKLMTESQKRLADCQVKLGITREQRATIINKAEGDVASLAISLDEKLKKVEKIKEKHKKEEKYFLKIKEERSPVNIIPPAEKIQAMIGETISSKER